MLASVFSKAETAAHELARDAGITLLVVVLQFGAVLFVFGGIAWGLTYVVAPPFALIITGAALGATAAITLAVKRGDRSPEPPAKEEARSSDAAPASSLMDSLTSVAGTFDVVAAGMFTRQLQRRPVSTIAATVAVGMLLGMLADAGDDD